MPRILIDNRPPQVAFQDGNVLSDAVTNFATTLVRAPIAADEIRRRTAADGVAQAFRQQQMDRQSHQDSLAQLWHDEGTHRQQEQDERAAGNDAEARRHQQFTEAQALAQMGMQNVQHGQANRLAERQFESLDADRKADNARQTAGMLGTGAAKAAELIGGLFGKGKQGTKINASTGWHTGTDGDGNNVYFRTGADGDLEIYDPKTGATTKASQAPQHAPMAAAPATEDPTTPWTLRRSDQPGVNTLGDFLGGRWFGDGGQPAAAAPDAPPAAAAAPAAPAAPAPGPVTLWNGSEDAPEYQSAWAGVQNSPALLAKYGKRLNTDAGLVDYLVRVHLGQQGATHAP